MHVVYFFLFTLNISGLSALELTSNVRFPYSFISVTGTILIFHRYNTYAGNKVRATDCIAFNIWHLKHSASYHIVQLFENYLCQISDTACSTLYCPTGKYFSCLK